MKTHLKALVFLNLLGVLAGCSSNKLVNGTAKAADTTPPVFVSFTASSSPATTSGQQAVVAADVTDETGVAKVAFYRVVSTGTNPVLSFLVDDKTSPYQNTFNFTNSTQNGTYSYLAKAYDAAGNVTTSSQAQYSVDVPCTTSCVSPTIRLVALTAASPTTHTSLVTTAGLVTLTPIVTNAKKVEFYRVTGTTESLIYTDESAPFALPLSFTKVKNGKHTYKAKVISASGVSAADTASFTVRIKDKTLAVGISHSVAVKTDGTVLTWGFNNDGQLGNGTSTLYSSKPVTARTSAITAVAAGGHHSLALKADGTVLAWGWNAYGQLGNGTTIGSSTPVPVNGVSNAVAIAASKFYSLALKADGTVLAWGFNNQGQLGNGTTTDSSTPVTVVGATNVVAIAANNEYSLALKADGTVLAWGLNSVGQLGNGTTINSSMPVPVIGVSNAVAIAAGGSHGLALKADGTMQVWGSNGAGQFGNDAIIGNNPTPVAVGIGNVVDIATGASHSLVIKADGTMLAWGYGKLGSNVTSDSIPATITGANNVVAIATGSHSLALKADGTVLSWGQNQFGELGDGTTVTSSTPVAVTLDTDRIKLP